MKTEQERHIYISVLICLVIFLMLWGSFMLYRYATDTINPAASWFEVWSTPLLIVVAIIYTIRNLRIMKKK
jgi:TRAP-type C4-dicarboxylate transport system permease small subunit